MKKRIVKKDRWGTPEYPESVESMTVKTQDKRDVMFNAAEIVDEYLKQGLRMTTRQIWYQFIARGIPIMPDRRFKVEKDRSTEFEKLITQGRYMGIIDWDAIADRSREHTSRSVYPPRYFPARWSRNSHDGVARRVLNSGSITIDHHYYQPYHIELWCEKNTLADLLAEAASDLGLGWFCCGGNSSVTILRERARAMNQRSKETVMLYFGDWDPSGCNMDRSIQRRLNEFGCTKYKFVRAGIFPEQAEAINAPPFRPKSTDKSAPQFIEDTGSDKCWEIDTLPPPLFRETIEKSVEEYMDASIQARISEIEDYIERRLDRERHRLYQQYVDGLVDCFGNPIEEGP